MVQGDGGGRIDGRCRFSVAFAATIVIGGYLASFDVAKVERDKVAAGCKESGAEQMRFGLFDLNTCLKIRENVERKTNKRITGQ